MPENAPPYRLSQTHVLKCWPQYFAEVVNGSKTFEVRLNDRDFQQGDSVILREYDPDNDTYSGRSVHASIGYVLRESCAAIPDFDGHVVFSLRAVTTAQNAPQVQP